MQIEEKIWMLYDEVGTTACGYGYFATAEAMFVASLEEARRGKESWHRLGRSWCGLATVYHRRGEIKEAMHFYRKAIIAFENTSEASCRRLAFCCENLAVLYISEGFLVRARTLLRRAINIYEKVFDAQHPALSPAMMRLGYLYSLWNQPDKALFYYTRAKALRRQ